MPLPFLAHGAGGETVYVISLRLRRRATGNQRRYLGCQTNARPLGALLRAACVQRRSEITSRYIPPWIRQSTSRSRSLFEVYAKLTRGRLTTITIAAIRPHSVNHPPVRCGITLYGRSEYLPVVVRSGLMGIPTPGHQVPALVALEWPPTWRAPVTMKQVTFQRGPPTGTLLVAKTPVVCAAGHSRVAELHVVVLPTADGADVVTPVRLAEGDEAAARARIDPGHFVLVAI